MQLVDRAASVRAFDRRGKNSHNLIKQAHGPGPHFFTCMAFIPPISAAVSVAL